MTEIPTRPQRPFRALVAGAGIAGLEAVLALRDLAGDDVQTTLLAPDPVLHYRPLDVRAPFTYAPAGEYDVAEIAAAAGATLMPEALDRVDPAARVAHTASGAALPYDALLLAMGARRRSPFDLATTVDDRRIDRDFEDVLRDVESGAARRLAFLVPDAPCWPLPLYELALMTAARAHAMRVDVRITIVTADRVPLEIFGAAASAAVDALLGRNGIAVETQARGSVPQPGRIVIAPGDRHVDADRVVTMPVLSGPGVRGLPFDGDAFLPVDDRCRVRGVDGVFAAGDATDFPLKHGGLSSQMADTAALAIAHLAGAAQADEPFRPRMKGLLLTGRDPLYLSAAFVGGAGLRSRVAPTPLWSPDAKVAARYLAPVLRGLDRVRAHSA